MTKAAYFSLAAFTRYIITENTEETRNFQITLERSLDDNGKVTLDAFYHFHR